MSRGVAVIGGNQSRNGRKRVKQVVRGQRGISFVGLIFVLLVLAFVGLIGLRLFPFYMTSFKVDKAVTAVVEDPSMRDESVRAIVRSIVKRLDIDDVTFITEKNFNDYVVLSNNDGKIVIDVYYNEEAHLFANIFLRVEFEKHFEN